MNQNFVISTNTEYFMKLPDEAINIKIDSDDYYVRSGFYTEYDIFRSYDEDNYSIDESWPRVFAIGDFYMDDVGFLNKDSEIIIEPIYDDGHNFENGIGSVSMDGEYGIFINENGKYGFIDKTGNFVIPPQFDDPANFYEDVATCKIGNYYYIIEKTKI